MRITRDDSGAVALRKSACKPLLRWGGLLFLSLFSAGLLPAQTPVDEDAPWPRVRATNGHTVTLHLPQVERWTSNSFSARAAVEMKLAGGRSETLGVIWFEAHGQVDRSNRVVTLDRMEVTRGRFPSESDGGSNALAIVRQVLPGGARTVSFDYLVTALGFTQAAVREGMHGLKHDPPQIIWATNRTQLILIDGEPVLKPVPGSSLARVINTPALLIQHPAGGRFYLAGDGQWFSATALAGPWALAQTPPAEVAALSPVATNRVSDLPPPRIIVSTKPTELIMTSGLPDYHPVRGTQLLYVSDTDSLLFFNNTDRGLYVLLSGRWYHSQSLHGPWAYVEPDKLPADFARIPPGTPQAMALASVPNTPQSELALMSASVPTTATVSRKAAKIELRYDGEPSFKPIEGTSMHYAVNARLPVIRLGETYYAVDDAVWFVAKSPTGPWEVATEVPEEIYTIPPSSPVYFATFVRVYDADEDSVETGYTSGYCGNYEDDGTLVYGTGYEYEPWYGDEYYGWGWSWGYGYYYVPWYGYWVWRPWWGEMGGLRLALIDNVYDRWVSRPGGVTPHDRVPNAAASSAARTAFAGHPALYGRFRGANRPEALMPPASTIALNPYARPQSPARVGEIPKGAQLLTNVRQSPGGGRDLYASPDGNVYLRRDNNWYRREPGGNWANLGPVQGTVQRSAGAQSAAGLGRATVAPNARATGNGVRSGVPDMGNRMRAQEIADLERQHYTRTLSQMRAQSVRSAPVSRPVRSGGAVRGGRR